VITASRSPAARSRRPSTGETAGARDVVGIADDIAMSERREDWMHASTRITRQLLAADGDEPLALIAQTVAGLAGARLVAVVLPTVDGTRAMVEVAAGDDAQELIGFTFPIAGSLTGRALSSGEAATSLDPDVDDTERIPIAQVLDVGPVMAVPLVGASCVRGALLIGRSVDEPCFAPLDADLATTFANHAALALEIADARSDRQRLQLLEDRTRIANDLHDHVVQRLFAAALRLQTISHRPEDDPERQIDEIVTGIHDTIAQIRTTIFGLRMPNVAGGTIRGRVLAVVTEMSPVLPCEPEVVFSGPVDTVVDDDELAADLLAVVREALSNAGRHAGATTVRLALTVTSADVALEVIDDGIGVGRPTRRSGLANMRDRALRHGGALIVAHAHAPGTERRGTRLEWTAKLP
jgi:signal transduction histidine kinase